jgi:hypothetical protein
MFESSYGDSFHNKVFAVSVGYCWEIIDLESIVLKSYLPAVFCLKSLSCKFYNKLESCSGSFLSNS